MNIGIKYETRKQFKLMDSRRFWADLILTLTSGYTWTIFWLPESLKNWLKSFKTSIIFYREFESSKLFKYISLLGSPSLAWSSILKFFYQIFYQIIKIVKIFSRKMNLFNFSEWKLTRIWNAFARIWISNPQWMNLQNSGLFFFYVVGKIAIFSKHP
jgi:hypothetical protein